jgi:hypothetical protein
MYYNFCKIFKKKWFWETREVWIGYPEQFFTNDMYYYYLITLGFYLSLLITQFFDVKRKDFWIMFAHHVVTIGLLVFSYICNYTRIGCLIILIHDSADFLLELAKLGVYTKNRYVSDIAFGIFTFVFFITRLVIYPSR